ncbi:hypothetical protein [Bradyrhizobium sp.]|uniref:hypothetical protein n=1 Tax=Bradyrhizobium sp. TaxID=376 RepID=UPI0040379BB2
MGIRISPKADTGRNQSVTFVLAIGSARQICRLKTTFDTQNQALSYLQRHRTALELAARARFARGEIEDGIVELKML